MTKKKQTTTLIVPYRGQSNSKAKRKKQVKITKAVTPNEVSQLGQALRALGGGLGSAAGGYLGYPVAGGQIGHTLGAALSKWMGAGDYQIAKNTLLSSGDVPAMHNTGQSIVVRHKEFVTEVTSSINFLVRKTINLNPGLPGSFPWLSNVAKNYQEYKIRGMVFHYVPTSGTAVGSTNTALGSVMFQTTYRASDAPPGSKAEMLNEYCANECVPSDTVCHPIECDPKENPFQIQYTRNTAIPAGDSQLLYDLGTTYIAVTGQQANDVVLGDVWVTYEVELKKPVVITNTVAGDSYFAQTLSTGSYVFAGIEGSTLRTSPGLFISSLTNSMRFNTIPGRYYSIAVLMRTDSGAVSTTQITMSVASGGSLVNGPYASLTGETIYGTTCYGTARWITMKATETSAIISFSPPTVTPGGVNYCTVIISSYN